MTAWMLGVTVLAAAVSGLAWIAERGADRLNRPARFIWLAAMAISLAPVGSWALSLLPLGPAGLTGPGGSTAAAEVSSAGRLLNITLLVLWATGSVIVVASIRTSAWTLRRILRECRPGWLAGELVLVSDELGPAVVGLRDSRCVVPRAVMDWEPDRQGLVMAHEREHVRTGDPWLLAAGLAAAAVAPWCLPLWWQLQRLREAVECDCDARVLVRMPGNRAEYAQVLLTFAARGRRRTAPIAALATEAVEVERRISRLVDRRTRPATGWALIGVAAVLSVLVAISVPRLPTPNLAFHAAPRPPVDPLMFQPPPSARIILQLSPMETVPPEQAVP